MSRAREFADLASSADAGGITGKNLIINGAMQVAQRGTSFADLNGYNLDRFEVGSSDDGAVTVTQDTTVPSGQGFKNSMKFDVTTADTSIGASQYYQFYQKIEGQNVAHLMWGTSDAKSVTLSFWCRSNKTGTYVITFMNNAADRLNPNNFTINSANTWEKKTITLSGDTTGTWLTTNGIGLYVIWNLALGSDYQDGTNGTWGSADYGSGATVNFLDSTSNEFYITGIQLEVGEQATPFEHRSYGDELAKCQRYYYQTTYRGAGDTTLLSGTVASGTTAAQCGDSFPVTMRSAPAVGYSGSITAYDGSQNNTVTAITANGSSTTNATINVTAGTGLTTGRAVQILSNASDEYLTFDAEL